eukprot:Amastigsp_a676195_31.p3 type:complete len:180 gc:universal Amastigsp_a676195_31:861-322(-)
MCSSRRSGPRRRRPTLAPRSRPPQRRSRRRATVYGVSPQPRRRKRIRRTLICASKIGSGRGVQTTTATASREPRALRATWARMRWTVSPWPCIVFTRRRALMPRCSSAPTCAAIPTLCAPSSARLRARSTASARCPETGALQSSSGTLAARLCSVRICSSMPPAQTTSPRAQTTKGSAS